MRHYLLALMLLAVLAGCRQSKPPVVVEDGTTLAPPVAEAGEPNQLTPKEIADGWLLLFDGETTFGWQIDGEGMVAKGTLVIGGGRESTAAPTMGFGNCDVAIETRWEGEDPPMIRSGAVTLTLAAEAKERFFKQQFGFHGKVLLPDADNQTDQVRPPLIAVVPAGTRLFLRSVKLQPTWLEPLCNGKDLTGWDQSLRGKAQVSVTDKGAINVEGGPGELRTEKKWADFVLQLECLIHNKDVATGLYVRCLPGEPHSGYKVQLHNEFTAEPRREYPIEEYDPRSHLRTTARKVKYRAVDHGLGGLHGFQPARRPVVGDGEWLTLTVAAQGRKIATWVNGIQVTDWTDNRPRADEPLKGCFPDPGPISLLGSRSRSDVSFRNIRIGK